MKVMIIAEKCSLQCPPDDPVAEVRYEMLLTGALRGRIEGAVVYQAQDGKKEAFCRDGLTYYPVSCRMDPDLTKADWEETRRQLLRVIKDFSPDVIQCMGAEWPYGLIAESVSIPVVIHMMGFLNAYYTELDMVNGYFVTPQGKPQPERKMIRFLKRCRAWVGGKQPEPEPEKTVERITDANARRERRVMAAVHYFMGRTEWDRNLAKYYSPGSKYYHVEELLKPRMYEAAGQWLVHRQKNGTADGRRAGRPLRLLTISSGDDRKGNEIILRTALLLRDLLKLNVEWRVAGHPEFFERYEKITGIRHEDVNVKLIGYIDSAQVVEELKRADLFIHPSIIDNSPHAVCEAQMIGCPVIASHVGGVADLVEGEETGFLYPYHEPHALAFLIGNVAGEEERLKKVSENAMRAASRRHDPDGIAKALCQVYEDILREQGKRG
ncbi:MAG: glycosyltransferase [Clostridia bacterium]|nr:glycosyltransferase [Clostridia bacterium]